MANSHEPIAPWEWDSVLSLSEPSSSILDQDSAIGSWSRPSQSPSPPHRAIHFQHPVNSPSPPARSRTPSSQPAHFSESSAPTTAGSELPDSNGTATTPDRSPDSFPSGQSPDHSSGTFLRGKGDPRLSCPNFLAGRVPCSCPEEDEAENDEKERLSRKRAKGLARCQVPSCRVNISHLKGYHQRHKVCLGCANSAQVILNDQPHRYCQQCGKFHLLPDFDEGKRSCRRKLDKHNRRRRRKTVEAGEATEKGASVLSSDKENHSASFHLDASANHQEVRSSSSCSGEQSTVVNDIGGKLTIGAKQNCQPSTQPTEQPHIEGPVTRAVFPSESTNVSVMCGLVSSSAGVAGVVTHPGRSHINEASIVSSLEVPDGPFGAAGNLNSFGSNESVANTTKRDFQTTTIENPCANETSSIFPIGPRHEFSETNGNVVDEQSLLALLMDDSLEGDALPCSPRLARLLHFSESDMPKSSLPCRGYKNQIDYCSPCTTGRVSFKLYDWNPADFPRRLRQQIFEWLANMPIELEGYIRSGCTILTLFFTMPQSMWDKLNDDWAGYVQKVLCWPGHGFLGSGRIIARLNNKSLQIENGQILNKDYQDSLSPCLIDVYPLCVEAGCMAEIFVHGKNLFRKKSRFLISFGEQYLECGVSVPVGCADLNFPSKVVDVLRADDFESCKLTACTQDCLKFGPAYIEVDHDLGVSHFIPILIAEKSVCAEVNSLKQTLYVRASCHDCQTCSTELCKYHLLKRQRISDLLLDLGWVLRYLKENISVDRVEVREALLKRLQKLLFFSVRQGWYVVTQRVLQAAHATELITKLVGGPGWSNALQMAVTYKHWKIVELFMDLERICSNECSISVSNRNAKLCDMMVDIEESDYGGGVPCGLYKQYQPVESITQCQWGNEDPFQIRSKFLDVETLILPLESRSQNQWDHEHVLETVKSSHSGSNLTDSETLISPLVSLIDTNMEVPLLERSVSINDKNTQEWLQKTALVWFKRPTRNRSRFDLPAKYERGGMRRIVLTAVSLVTVCAGACLVLQHPHQVTEISMSLRRCLWGAVQNGASV